MDADLIERLAMDAMLTAPIEPTAGDGVRITCSCGDDATAFVRRFAALVAEECAKLCEAQADRAKEQELSKRCDRLRGGDMQDDLAALKFHSTVSTYNAGINRCIAAIMAKFPPP